MNYWEKFNETSYPGNEDFYSESVKYGRYYWYRLRECKKGLSRFWNKQFRRIS